MNNLPSLGKGCYLWRPKNMFGGNITAIINAFKAAKVQHVAIKITDGTYKYIDIYPLVNALWGEGITIGAWSYIYLAYNPWGEASKAADQIEMIKPAYFLLDIEGQSTWWQNAKANILMNTLRARLPTLPMGLNTFWKPSWHPQIPYTNIRRQCDFDAPQIYSRGDDPVLKYNISRMEYATLLPHLPFGLPAGDMYYEHGIMPKPGDITKFMTRARQDPQARGVVMWSADQCETTPNLWNEFSAFDWNAGTSVPLPPPVEDRVPLYSAVCTVDYTRVRTSPQIISTNITAQRLMKGDRVEVWKVINNFAAINKEETLWAYSPYLIKL